MGKQKLPKVGMRMIKTIVSAFICAMIGYFRGQAPFYSMIAAILCIQNERKKSVRTALNRTVGTVIGGIFGFIILMIVQYTQMSTNVPAYYLFISLSLLPLIYITVLIEKSAAAYITCVVFLSITVSHITDEIPALFVLNRMLDTLIGIGVSLIIDKILVRPHILKRKKVNILPAKLEDLEDIQALQYLAYQSEAMLLNDNTIPPLRQSLDEIRAEYENGILLKAVQTDGAIIGSIRGYQKENTLYIGKLIVHPDCRGKGIGTQLLNTIEKYCPCSRYELFTSSKSLKNLALYKRKGYRIYKEEIVSSQWSLIYLEKYVI